MSSHVPIERIDWQITEKSLHLLPQPQQDYIREVGRFNPSTRIWEKKMHSLDGGKTWYEGGVEDAEITREIEELFAELRPIMDEYARLFALLGDDSVCHCLDNDTDKCRC